MSPRNDVSVAYLVALHDSLEGCLAHPVWPDKAMNALMEAHGIVEQEIMDTPCLTPSDILAKLRFLAKPETDDCLGSPIFRSVGQFVDAEDLHRLANDYDAIVDRTIDHAALRRRQEFEARHNLTAA